MRTGSSCEKATGRSVLVGIVALIAVALAGLAVEECDAADVVVKGVIYSAAVEDGAVVLRDVLGKDVTLPADAGIRVSPASDGRGVRVESATGEAVIRTRNRVMVTVSPGKSAEVTEDPSGQQVTVKSLVGPIRGVVEWKKGNVW